MNLFKNYRDSIQIKDHVKNSHVHVGDYSYYAGYYHGHSFDDCVLYLDELENEKNPDQLMIGKFCSIASGAKFMLGGTHGHNHEWIAAYPLDSFDTSDDSFQTYKAHKWKGNTIIGNDVWMGYESLILPGVRIADGAVIAARAVVAKNVGPYEIWGGNPARLIKKRFSDEEIQKLLQIKWWDWDIAILKRNLSDLRSKNVKLLWEKFEAGEL